jgi:6,7-dimethyl-8-ribityllumazine synthase
MGKEIKADLIAKGLKFCIVVSRFNEFMADNLLKGAVDTLLRHGASNNDLEVVWCPGTFEMPGVVQRLSQKSKYDAIICLGVIIRGDTPHFDYIASQVARGLAQINLGAKIPVSFGIITADTIEQAIDRAGTKEGNKGRTSALAAIEMANLYRKI